MSVNLDYPVWIKNGKIPVRYVGRRTDGRLIVEMPVSDRRLVSLMVREHELENVPSTTNPEIDKWVGLSVLGAALAVGSVMTYKEVKKRRRGSPFSFKYWFS